MSVAATSHGMRRLLSARKREGLASSISRIQSVQSVTQRNGYRNRPSHRAHKGQCQKNTERPAQRQAQYCSIRRRDPENQNRNIQGQDQNSKQKPAAAQRQREPRPDQPDEG